MMKFRQMVSIHVKIRLEVKPEDSMVPSRLMSGTIVQTVKVWMQRMIKIIQPDVMRVKIHYCARSGQ